MSLALLLAGVVVCFGPQLGFGNAVMNCSSFSCSDMGYYVMKRSPSSIQCTNGTCDVIECCDFGCPGTVSVDGATGLCANLRNEEFCPMPCVPGFVKVCTGASATCPAMVTCTNGVMQSSHTCLQPAATVANWVGEANIGIPAKGLFVIVFTTLAYVALCGMIHVAFVSAGVGESPATAADSLPSKLMKSKQFWYRLLFLILSSSVGLLQIESTCGERGSSECLNWHLMFWYGIFLIITSNISTQPFEFYLGEGNNFVDTLKFYLRNKPMKTAEELKEVVRSKYSAKGDECRGVGFWTLMPSTFVTWIFATSIRNSSVLGGRYGILGGLTYDAWYLSFFSSAILCYILRTKYRFKSLPTAVYKNYGALAVFCFQLCLLFRLFNSVWSNATVIGLFYGPAGSSGYWGACWTSVLIPAVYVLMGGMRSSLFSDVSQAALAIIFLVVVLGTIASDTDFAGSNDAFSYSPKALWGSDGSTEGWQPGWWACFLGGCIQGVFSYPFFDPTLTDRAFLATPRTMMMSFMVGGLLAALFIFFYAVIGVYGAWAQEKYMEDCGCVGGMPIWTAASRETCPVDWNPCSRLTGEVGEASDVAWILGRRTYRAAEIYVNFIMITASLSTLGSAFTSSSKLVSLEFGGWLGLSGDNRRKLGPLRPHDQENIGSTHMIMARVFICFLAFMGTCFLGYEKDAMNATTIGGTSIMGIGLPIWWMSIWRTKGPNRKGWVQAPLAFVVPFCVGWVFGVSYFINGKEEQGWTYELMYYFDIGTYTSATGVENTYMHYSRFLITNLVGNAVVMALFFIFFAFHQLFPNAWLWKLEEVEAETDDVILENPVQEEPIEVPIKVPQQEVGVDI